MSIAEKYMTLGVTHTPINCGICGVTYTTPVRTSTKTWSKR